MKGSLQQLQIKALALCCSLVVYFSGILGFKGRCKVRFWGALLRHPSLTISWPNAPLNLNLNNSYLPVKSRCDPPFLKLFLNVGPFRKSCGFGSSKVSSLVIFFLIVMKEYQKVELSKSKPWLVCLVASEAAVHEGCTGLSGPKFVGWERSYCGLQLPAAGCVDPSMLLRKALKCGTVDSAWLSI